MEAHKWWWEQPVNWDLQLQGEGEGDASSVVPDEASEVKR